MKNLDVIIDHQSGFCFGVVYAIHLAEEILNETGSLYCLEISFITMPRSIVSEKGLKIITHAELKNLRNEQVLIRAHGEPPSTYALAMENNLNLVDASCPVVLKLQNRVKQTADQNKKIFIYGKTRTCKLKA